MSVRKDKEICWVGSSYQDLLDFPVKPLKAVCYQLEKVQAGLEPDNWKSFDDVGVGTKEIHIRDNAGIYRVMYIAKFEEAVLCSALFPEENRSNHKTR